MPGISGARISAKGEAPLLRAVAVVVAVVVVAVVVAAVEVAEVEAGEVVAAVVVVRLLLLRLVVAVAPLFPVAAMVAATSLLLAAVTEVPAEVPAEVQAEVPAEVPAEILAVPAVPIPMTLIPVGVVAILEAVAMPRAAPVVLRTTHLPCTAEARSYPSPINFPASSAQSTCGVILA